MIDEQSGISEPSVWQSSTPTSAAFALPFRTTEVGLFYTNRLYTVSRKYYDSFLLLFTLSGEGHISVDPFSADLSAGDAILIDCRQPHNYACRRDWCFYWIHINGECISSLSQLLYPSGIEVLHLHHPPAMQMVFDALLTQNQRRDLAALAEQSENIHRLLSLLLSHRSAAKQSNGDVERVIRFIEANYAKPITVDDMLRGVHLSKYHFIRTFGKVTGVTPYHYLINYRMNQGKHLLRTTSLRIAEIADRCGFADASSFCSLFKKHAGQKPSEYRAYFVLHDGTERM